jgi:hypothetical protein
MHFHSASGTLQSATLCYNVIVSALHVFKLET